MSTKSRTVNRNCDAHKFSIPRGHWKFIKGTWECHCAAYVASCYLCCGKETAVSLRLKGRSAYLSEERRKDETRNRDHNRSTDTAIVVNVTGDRRDSLRSAPNPANPANPAPSRPSDGS